MDPQIVQILNAVLLIAGVAALAGALIAATLNKITTWKASLIVAVILICIGGLIPPSETLNLGIDLRGGTSMLYSVDVPANARAEETLKRVVDVMQRRLDPNGVRNLVFTIESGNRIQIQMPHASPEVTRLRKEFEQLFESIGESNIPTRLLSAGLRADPATRAAQLEAMVKGVEARKQLLTDAAAAYDAYQATRKQREGLDRAADQAKYDALTARIAEAQGKYEETIVAFENTNLDPIRMRRTLELATVREIDRSTGERIVGSSAREKAIDGLRGQHPLRAEQIDQLVAAYDAYSGEKQPLDSAADVIRLLKGQGVLEFRIAVQPGVDLVPPAEIEALREQLAKRGVNAQRADAPMRWLVVDNADEWLKDSISYARRRNPGRPTAEIAQELGDLLRDNPAEFFQSHYKMIGAGDGERYYLLLWNTLDKSMTGRDQGWQLTNSYTTMDQKGLPAVGFSLNTRGASFLGALTKNNLQRPMAIVLDARVYSAPNINGVIRDSGIIEGNFSQAELDYLINTLNAGSLNARLSEEPIQIREIQPFIGADNLDKGFDAAVQALIVVVIFMMGYYFFAGLVADLALLVNLVIILGIMATLQATFTLPGIAGIVLTIGMCVDANVLIFERIREELKRGADMPTALRLGYEKAFSSIIDGNLTNLIVCLILGYTATADVKGFAVTLGVGICATLFTSLFMTRVIFTLYYSVMGHRKLNMLPMTFPAIDRLLHPSYQWITRRGVFFTISGVMLVGSLALIKVRGDDIFDIEFRGGTEVSFDLKEGQRLSLADSRARLEQKLVNYVVIPLGEMDADLKAGAFSVVTTETDPNAVADVVRRTFADVLDIQPAIAFAGETAGDLSEAPVYEITDANLGTVIGRPAVTDEVSDHLGGVAIVLDAIEPPATTQQIADRIKTMRFQPDYENVKFRATEVIGLEADADEPSHFVSVVVVVQDSDVNYFDDPELWRTELAATEWNLVRDAMRRPQSLSKVSNFTPTVARTIRDSAIVALGLSIFAIVAYIWIRFGSLRYGLAAIAALVHDVIITLGLVALSAFVADSVLGQALLLDPFKINMAMIAAMLTIIGYSLNDTIVLFDRIRENRGKLAVATPGIINDSINQVISRTVLTSLTTFMAVGMMYLFGGPGIHGFAFALTIGVVVGTYSSIAIASPLLLVGVGVRRTKSS